PTRASSWPAAAKAATRLATGADSASAPRRSIPSATLITRTVSLTSSAHRRIRRLPAMPSIGRSGVVLASGTLVSRVLGFVNALLLYNTIGTVGQGADAFALANQLPNNIFALIAGGTLTAVIVPAIVKATGHADGGER